MKEEESIITPSAFNIPAPSPRFSELPKPTLPKIEKPKLATSSLDIIDLGRKPEGGTMPVVIGGSEDVENDNDVSATTTNIKDVQVEPSDYDMSFGGFSANAWVMASGATRTRMVSFSSFVGLWYACNH